MVLMESAKRGAAVPGPDHGSGSDGPEADEEDPARQEAEAVLQGVYERHEALAVADRGTVPKSSSAPMTSIATMNRAVK